MIHSREAVIIDVGAATVKTGYSGDDGPKEEFPTCVGYEGAKGQGGTSYVGDEAFERQGAVQMSYPSDYGLSSDWGEMEAIWRYALEEKLNCVSSAPQEADEDVKGVLTTESALLPMSEREKCCEVMFEQIGVRRWFMARQATLSLYTAGRTTGVSVDVGHSNSNAVPVVEGQCAIKVTRAAGGCIPHPLPLAWHP